MDAMIREPLAAKLLSPHHDAIHHQLMTNDEPPSRG